MSSVSKFYKIIQPQHRPFSITDNQDVAGNVGLYGNYTWYHRLVQGSASRMIRYREYDLMDADTDVNKALDLITDEVLGNTSKTESPLEIKITAENEELVKSSIVVTLKAALKTWCTIQKWQTRIFPLVRDTVKYGDTFFIRPSKKKFAKYLPVHPKNVIAAIVPEDDVTEVLGWNIKTDYKRAQNMPGVSADVGFTGGANDPQAYNVEVFSAEEIVRFSLHNDMSEEAPFGESILRAVYKTFKQKELLEDSVLIYRIQRAPERRVFKIDVGKMPPQKVAAHLEQVKNEFRQKKVPTPSGGQNRVESIYNPQSQYEDFFVAKREDGQGTEIEVLPSGQNLGELQDLQYFYKRLWRGLRIPQSYMDVDSDGGTFNDGKVGIAFQQEIIFIMYIERLQKLIETTFDAEFKRFLYDQNIKIDSTIFRVVLPSCSNFAKAKQQAMDADLMNNYNNIIQDESISKRFAQKKYLGLSEEEIILNARMKLEEKGIDPDTAKRSDLMAVYSPLDIDAGGAPDGGLGGGGGGGMDEPLFDDEGETADGEEGGEDLGGADEGVPEPDLTQNNQGGNKQNQGKK